jgi:hypothetical protein
MRLVSAIAAAGTVSVSALATAPILYAQEARTWVSGLGDDAADCSRATPCKTFAGALSKTAAGGEISVVDPGQYGNVTITKSITIDGGGVLAAVTVAGTSAISIVAGDQDVVILRNLELHGLGTFGSGVSFRNGKLLIVENTAIAGFASSGLLVQRTTGAGNMNVIISNSSITGNRTASASNGILTTVGATLVRHSVITRNTGAGLLAMDGGVITADSNVLAYNGTAVKAGNTGPGQANAMVRVSNNNVYGNLTGFSCGGGVIASTGDNRKGGNTGGTAPICSPAVAITQQ